MKVSYNWLKDYLDINLPADELGDILTAIGLEVEGMETHESIPGGLEGLIIGEVLTCQKHPDADRLSITTVNTGQGEPQQIVCGAPNVAAGQKVVIATPGTTLYPEGGEPFKIKKSKIRGAESHGMICAEDEIGLGKGHDGIMVLPEETLVGTLAADYFEVERDVIYDIGLTPNRSDATCHLGVAEDLAAYLQVHQNHSGLVTPPPSPKPQNNNNGLPIEVVLENEERCPRYSGISLSNITVKESPDWLKNRLNAIGVRPISNVVDITNYILHGLGQPLHAFDADKIAGKKIIVKTLPEGTSFLSLDEVERKLSAEDLMICDGDSKGMCIGGVFGGLESGVTDSTKNIFLEAAYFNPTSIRRSSTRHNLRTDAAKVFEKGSDPNNTVTALFAAVHLLQELAGAEIASELIDIYPSPIAKTQIDITYKNVNRLIGNDLSPEQVKNILTALKIDILEETDAGLKVSIPTNKADVKREADVTEEILRIYGFDNVKIDSSVRSTLNYMEKPNRYQIRNILADFLQGAGFNEIMATSITQSNYFTKILPTPEETLVRINNTSNQHLDVMRPNMVMSGLETILNNQNRGAADLRLFELGRTYRKTGEDQYEESEHLSLFLTGQKFSESWLDQDKALVSYFTLKTYVEQLLERLGLSGYQQTSVADDVFQYGLQYHRGPQELVRFGQVQPKIQRGMDIKRPVFYASFNIEVLVKALKNKKLYFAELSKYPSMRRDLALVIDKTVNFSEIAGIARKNVKKLLKSINLFDVYVNADQIGANKKSCAISLVFQGDDKNLKGKEVDKIMEKLIRDYETKLNAEIRR